MNSTYRRLPRPSRFILSIILFCCTISQNTATTESTTTNNLQNNNNNKPPNIIIIITDEQNLRTLGCYRDLLTKDQSHVWGPNVQVDTPHIDSIARDGAIFTNFFSVSPTCTPSRAALLSGNYPNKNGAFENHKAMHKSTVTFAKVLQDELNYYTGYIGKWHLNGRKKDPTDFGAPKGRSFGFDDTKYLWNRGHWKYLTEDDNGNIRGYTPEEAKHLSNLEGEKSYATKFLVDKALDFIEKKKDGEQPFALMVSLPDPHGPNFVHPPYDTMFDHLDFEVPESAVSALYRSPALPKWSKIWTKVLNPEDVPQIKMEKHIRKMEWQTQRQDFYRPIFGMVKAIDDNVGRILKKLRKSNLEKNTILVFTSDHGDMMGEHARDEKQTPYKTSAGVPFLVRWPDHIVEGKVVESSVSSVDFSPTLLNMLGIDSDNHRFDGLDFSEDVLSDSKIISDDGAISFSADTWEGTWAAAMTSRYKLVLSNSDIPWLFDAEEDPDEIINYYSEDGYEEISKSLRLKLFDAMVHFDFPLRYETIFWDRPLCHETNDLIDLPRLKNKSCADFQNREKFKNICNLQAVRELCPQTCDSCPEQDSSGMIIFDQKLISCSDVRTDHERYCSDHKIKIFCPSSCSFKADIMM